jgi:hypothetical protein
MAEPDSDVHLSVRLDGELAKGFQDFLDSYGMKKSDAARLLISRGLDLTGHHKQVLQLLNLLRFENQELAAMLLANQGRSGQIATDRLRGIIAQAIENGHALAEQEWEE